MENKETLSKRIEENVPRLRFSEFTESWRRYKFGEISSVSMCHRIFKEQTSTNGDIPFYKIGTFGNKADAFISTELFEEYKTKYPYGLVYEDNETFEKYWCHIDKETLESLRREENGLRRKSA